MHREEVVTFKGQKDPGDFNLCDDSSTRDGDRQALGRYVNDT